MQALSLFLAGLIFALGLGCAGAASPQDWPTRPVTMVVTFAAGGGDDVVARILSPRLSELLGQQVIVENIGGAGGTIGVSRVANAAPDGYRFVLGGTGTFAANRALYKSQPYNTVTDFAPVILLAEQPILLVVRNDLPADNLLEFIAYSKANQAKMQYGSPGVGSSSHLACVLLNAAIGINVTHVPYRGGAPAYQDLLAGRIDYLCPYSSTAIPHIENKTIKAIASLARNRLPMLPNLRTADEQGLARFEAYQWFAIFLPRGTPAPIVQKLHDAALAAMNTPSVRERLEDIGAVAVPAERASPEYLQGFVESESEKWAAAIAAAHINVQ